LDVKVEEGPSLWCSVNAVAAEKLIAASSFPVMTKGSEFRLSKKLAGSCLYVPSLEPPTPIAAGAIPKRSSRRLSVASSLPRDTRVLGKISRNDIAGGADIPPCGTVKKPGQAMDRTR